MKEENQMAKNKNKGGREIKKKKAAKSKKK